MLLFLIVIFLFVLQSTALRRESKSPLRSSKWSSWGCGRYGWSQVSSVPSTFFPFPLLCCFHQSHQAPPLFPTRSEQRTANPEAAVNGPAWESSAVSPLLPPHTPPPGPPGEASVRLEPLRNHHHHHHHLHRCCCRLLLQHCTDATRSGPAIFILDSCTENLNCYEEKHTLMIFFSRLYTIVLIRWSVWHLAT